MQVFGAAPHHDVLRLVVQISVLLFAARALGEVAQRLKQPAVVGEILAGILLGPSLLSGFFPWFGEWIVPHPGLGGHLLEVVSMFGAMFLLLLTGLETDLALIRRNGRTAMGASLGGIMIPFATGFFLGLYLPASLLADPERRLVFALFMATAMSISAIPVIAKVLMDLKLMRRDIGQTIIAAGMTDDAIGWMLLSVVVGVASAGGVTAGNVAWSVGKVVGFIVLSFTVGRWIVRRALDYVQDRAISQERMLTLVVVVTFAWGAVSQGLGLEAMLGAFVVGILFGQMPRLPQSVHHSVEQVAVGIFAPIFFAVAGLKVDIRSLLEPHLILVALAVIGVACFGKIVGGYAGARILGGCDHWTALSFGMGLNARGAMEIIIASIGLSLGLLSQPMFSIIVVMAITTSLMAPPALRWTLKHVIPEDEELRRLRREELAVGSLLAGVRRILLPVRCRDVERRTILPMERLLVERLQQSSPVAVTLFTVAEQCDREMSLRYLDRVASHFPTVELSRKIADGPDVAAAILTEARKDYDLIVLGAPGSGDETQELFNPMVDYLMRVSPCPVIAVKGRLSQRNWPPERILVPTNGASSARNAADVAFALAAGRRAEVTVLNVVVQGEGTRSFDPDGAALRRQMATARTLVDELCKLGEAHEVTVHAEVRTGSSSEVTLLEMAGSEEFDLILLGTDLRPASDRLFLGPRVERILNHAPCPVGVVNA